VDFFRSPCARRCGAKHISKSKCTKHNKLGPLLEVEMSKKCTPLWREAHFEVHGPFLDVQMSFRVAGASDCAPIQKLEKRDGFVAFSTTTATTQHYTPIHYATTTTTPSLHSTTLHYPHDTPLHYTALHYAQLHSITFNYATLHYTTLHYTTLHSTTLHYNYNCNYNNNNYNYNALHNTTLQLQLQPQLHYTNCITLRYTTLH